MEKIYLRENLSLFLFSLLLAIAGMYSYKMMSFLLPLMTLMVIWSEGGIKHVSLQISPPLVFLFFLLLWSGISIFWANHQGEAIKIVITLTITFISTLFFLSCMLQASPNLISKAYTLIKFSGILLILFIIFQVYIDTFFKDLINYKENAPYMFRMKPTGSIVGLTTFVGCAFLWTNNQKFLSILIFFLSFFMISLTLCQTAYYGFILSTIVLILSYLMPFWITRIGIISSYTFLICSPIIFTSFFSASIISNLSCLKWLISPNFFYRCLAWEYYSKKFFESPFLGWGIGSSRHIPAGQEMAPGFSSLIHPHNNSIQAYAELGLIGGILYALFFSSLFFLVEKHVKDRLSIAVCNATITFGLIGAEITHNIWRNYWLSLVTLTTGLIILLIKSREEQLHALAYHLTQPLTP